MKKIFSIVSPPTFHLAPRSLAHWGLFLTFFQIGETENQIGQQNPNNLFIFAKKPKNQVLKNEKVYQESHWTTKTEKLNFF